MRRLTKSVRYNIFTNGAPYVRVWDRYWKFTSICHTLAKTAVKYVRSPVSRKLTPSYVKQNRLQLVPVSSTKQACDFAFFINIFIAFIKTLSLFHQKLFCHFANGNGLTQTRNLPTTPSSVEIAGAPGVDRLSCGALLKVNILESLVVRYIAK